jgi:hypothetical protein
MWKLRQAGRGLNHTFLLWRLSTVARAPPEGGPSLTTYANEHLYSPKELDKAADLAEGPML